LQQLHQPKQRWAFYPPFAYNRRTGKQNLTYNKAYILAKFPFTKYHSLGIINSRVEEAH
jgi:hypothetical protein